MNHEINYEEEYQTEIQNLSNALEKMHILSQKNLNFELPNERSEISFRTLIPNSIGKTYSQLQNKMIMFSQKNLYTVINDVVRKSQGTQTKTGFKSLTNAVNEFSYSIFFAPTSLQEINIQDALEYTESCYDYLLKRLAQSNLIANNEENPFLSSILRLFVFSAVLYSVARKDEIDEFFLKNLDIKQCDYSRLIYFNSNRVSEYFDQILSTPTLFSINFYKEIKDTKDKLENLLSSMKDVFQDEYTANKIIIEEDDPDVNGIPFTNPKPRNTSKRENNKIDVSQIENFAFLDDHQIHNFTVNTLKLYLAAQDHPNRKFYTDNV